MLAPLLLACLLAAPDDPEASYLLSRALLEEGGVGSLDRAVELAESAVDRAPDVARYQHQLGTALAREAMGGTFSALRLAGRIDRAFERAVALEPRWIQARQSLLGFRLLAPRWLGGSVDRAADQARAIERLDPFLGQLAWMAVHHAREAWPAFERAALAAAPLAIGRGHRRQLVALVEAAGYPVVDDRTFGPLWLVALPHRQPPDRRASPADAWAASEKGYAQALVLADVHETPLDVADEPAPPPPKSPPKARVKAKRRSAQAETAAKG